MNFFNGRKSLRAASTLAPLVCETLEERMMLSSVDIIAAGTTGVEQIELEINGVVVQTFDDLGDSAYSGGFTTFTYETSDEVDANDVRINFTNDLYDEELGIDRNVRVDAIVIDGERFETEAASVFSTGTWRPEDGIEAGFRESEYLHSNGYLQYSTGSNSGSEILIRVLGNEGGEAFNLKIDGQTVQSFVVGTELETISYTAADTVTADQIQIEFINDLWEPGVVDRNLTVDSISVDGQTFETESENVFSTGTWLPEDGIVAGFRQNDTLHTNGYFQFDAAPQSEPGVIELTLDEITIDEAAGVINFIVFRGQGSDGTVTVDYTTNFGTTDSNDHESISGTLTFNDGDTGQQLSVAINDDQVVEENETFTLTLLNPTGGATLGTTATQTVTIVDNDEEIIGVIFEESFEGSTVWTTNPFGTDTATTGAWAAGAPSRTESGGVVLQPDAGHTGSRALVTGLAAGTSVGTYDVDAGVTSVLSPTISLPDVPELAMTFEYSFAYLGNATADDYFSVSIVSDGITTELYDDHAHPYDQGTSWQLVDLDLSQFAGQDIQILFEAADLGTASLIEAAVDDIVVEALPVGPGVINVRTTGINLYESSGEATVILTRTSGRTGAVSVQYETVAGTAEANDFVATSGTVTFADGQSEVEIPVTIVDDAIEESLESFELVLSNPTNGATIGDDFSATITIVDNDNTVGDYLPDMLPIASTLTERLSLDTNEIPGRTLLRFSTEVANAGDGPLEIWGGSISGDSQQVFQRIYQEDGGSRDVLAGEFVYHPGHGHIHFEAFATYDLQLLDADGTIIASGGKTSFCLINIRQPFADVTAEAGVVHGRGGNSCGTIQGISTGYSDVYSAGLDDQWIDVTNVADGTYRLQITADPDNNIRETDETNNVASVQVTISNGQVSGI